MACIYDNNIGNRNLIVISFIMSDLLYVIFMNTLLLFIFLIHFSELFTEQSGRALHVIQALNGNKCNAYFVSGK